MCVCVCVYFSYVTCVSVLLQADVFSYGIILAEVISRIPADPDFMPRTQVLLSWCEFVSFS